MLVLCCCLTGCNLSGRKPAAPATPGVGQPFNPPAPDRARTPADPVSDRKEVNGLLAGKIVDRLSGRPIAAYIRVVDLEDPAAASQAPIDVPTDRSSEGLFFIPGLKPGRHYKLEARAKEGDHLLAGSAFVTAPDPRVTVYVSEEYATPSTPAIPTPTIYPNKNDGSKPAATLEAPTKPKDGSTSSGVDETKPTGDLGTGPSGQPAPLDKAAPAPNLSNVVDGFEKKVDNTPKVNINGPANGQPGSNDNSLPPNPGAPKWEAAPVPDKSKTPEFPNGVRPISNRPAAPGSVPYCVLTGKKLQDLVLYDSVGKVWDYRQERAGSMRNGRLLLIDFWSTDCGDCLEAAPKIVKLHRDYGPWGLNVVGIAYEKGTVAEQTNQIRGIRGRYSMRYPTLLGTGPDCPVRTQFNVTRYPTFVLLNEYGEIILQREGLPNERGFYELEMEIRKRLGLPN
jgi:thiol-disulfide isomerase/thioredoxin